MSGAIKALFWDIGGVILTNGWDRAARRVATERFALDWEDFEDRHDLAFPAYETGQVTLEEYLRRTIFYRARKFTLEEFTAFVFDQSKLHGEGRSVLRSVAGTGRYFVAALNNEGREINQFRIEKFGLRDDFSAFFSSCYLGVRKPDAGIYRMAVEISEKKPEESVFIDDRALNLECAKRMGMHTIQFHDARQLRTELQGLGVTLNGN
jgi:putative hydrolase of the HAD superfamily